MKVATDRTAGDTRRDADLRYRVRPVRRSCSVEVAVMKWATLLSDLGEAKERKQLHRRIQRLLDKWQPILGVTIAEWELRKMKNYWGSANNQTGHIIFNTELAKLPPKYVEYLVVHELVHQITDGHDKRFYELMDKHLPGWRKMQAKIEEPLERYS